MPIASFGGAYGQIAQQVFYIIIGLAVLGAVCGIAYVVMVLTRYNIKAVIFSRRAGSTKIIEDRAAYIKQRDGAWKYKLLRSRVVITPPEFDCLVSVKRKTMIFFYQAGIDEYYPLSPIPTIVNKAGQRVMEFKTDEKDVSLWTIEMMKAARNKFHQQTVWERYLPLAVVGMVGMISFLILYVMLQQIGDIAGLLQTTAIAFKEGARAMSTTSPPPGY